MKVLITGGTGTIGSSLTTKLVEAGMEVVHLSRKENKTGTVKALKWDLKNNFLAEDALEGVHSIVHLAGAGVADKRWTASYKKEILDSRIKSTDLLYTALKTRQHEVKSFLSASAIGIYPNDNRESPYTETDANGTNYLAEVTKAWEDEVDKVESLGIRVAKLRIGIVLSEYGGALEKMTTPIKYGVGAALGTGKQYLSWIHQQDLVNMFAFLIQNEDLSGVYNAVGPKPNTNKEITKSIASTLNKVYFLPNIPGFLLKIILGDMATMVLGGAKVSSQKIENAGFEFKYRELEDALTDLLIK